MAQSEFRLFFFSKFQGFLYKDKDIFLFADLFNSMKVGMNM